MVYVTSDIHGNSRRFNSILEKIQLTSDDTLYILGDVIDRHPDGIKLLQEIAHMKNVKMLKGNHEHMMLETICTNDKITYFRNVRLWYQNGGGVTYDAYSKLSDKEKHEVIEYIKGLPYQYNVEVNEKLYILVHAIPESMINSCYNLGIYDSIEECRVWHRLYKEAKVPDKGTLIFGHTPVCYLEDKNGECAENKSRYMSIWKGRGKIDIDCGSSFPDTYDRWTGKMGRLACLRLDDMKVFYSKESLSS